MLAARVWCSCLWVIFEWGGINVTSTCNCFGTLIKVTAATTGYIDCQLKVSEKCHTSFIPFPPKPHFRSVANRNVIHLIVLVVLICTDILVMIESKHTLPTPGFHHTFPLFVKNCLQPHSTVNKHQQTNFRNFSVFYKLAGGRVFKGHTTVPRPMPFYVNGSKRVKQRGGCGKKAVEVWKAHWGVWVSVCIGDMAFRETISPL